MKNKKQIREDLVYKHLNKYSFLGHQHVSFSKFEELVDDIMLWFNNNQNDVNEVPPEFGNTKKLENSEETTESDVLFDIKSNCTCVEGFQDLCTNLVSKGKLIGHCKLNICPKTQVDIYCKHRKFGKKHQ